MSNFNILVTGGAGFIGSNFVHLYNKKFPNSKIVVLDLMTYAASEKNLDGVMEKISFYKGGIGDRELVSKILREHKIDHIYNFAAESHVDNSISGPEIFIKTNVMDTFNLLSESLKYYENLEDKSKFKFLHVSTDEVFGSLELEGDDKFSEETAYQPNSPYSASKAASDHLVRAFIHTYKFPAITTNCTNNYGPRQFPEKLIPKTIKSCIDGSKITIYGNGINVRDWIWVDDHNEGIILAMHKGKTGESYCLGGNCEKRNIDVVEKICEVMNKLHPNEKIGDYKSLITFVQDRKGHDARYAMDCTKAKKELGFTQSIEFSEAIEKIIRFMIS